MFTKTLAVTAASLALFAGVGTTAASAQTTTTHASQAVTQSNGRLMKYAVGLLPRRGDFKPMAVAVSDQSGARVTANWGVANLNIDSGLRLGMVQAGNDIEPNTYAVALLDPESDLVMRIMPIQPGYMVQLW